MHKYHIIFLFLFSTLQAQQIHWSEKVSSKGVLDYAGRAGNFYFTTQPQGTDKVLLHRFDADLKLVKEDILLIPKGHNYLLSFVTPTEFVHVVTQNENRKPTTVLLLKSNLDNLSQTTTTLAAELKDGYRGVVYAHYSPDRSRILITNFSLKPSTSTINREFIVLDTRTGTVQFSGSSTINGLNDEIGVTNTGLVWVTAMQITSKQIRLLEKTKIQQQIIFIRPDNQTGSYILRRDTKYIPSVDVVAGEGSTVYFSGFAYDNDTKGGRIPDNELFIYTVDCEKAQVTDSAFTTVSGLYPANRLKAEDRLPYTIKQLHKKSDGSYTLLAEQYQFVAGQYSATSKYNDIACVQLNKDFSYATVTRIPKMQYGSDNPSFLSVWSGDTLHLFYNDHKDNLNAEEDKIIYPANKTVKNALFHVWLDGANKPTKQILYDYANGEPMPVIKGSLVENGEVVVVAEGMMGLMRW